MRKAVLGVTVIVAWLVVMAGPASAGRPSFQITPPSGAPGTTIHASDSAGECDGNDAHVTVSLQPASGGAAVTSTTIVPNSDGTWATDLKVPDATKAGSFSVTAHCDQDEGVDTFDYAPQSFTVTGATTTTTTPPSTTTTTAPVTTTTAAPVTVTAAPPAVAVTATPTMTG